MLRIIRSCLLLFFALCAGSVQAAAAPGRIVVFGDSLSDPGNYYAAFGTLSLPPYAPLPDSPYAIGRAHYSNGPTWIEQLADTLDRSGDARPALRHSAHAANYAVGRARARAAAAAFPAYDLSTQVGLFLADVHGAAPADALYVVWIGGNDIDDALSALSTDGSGAASAAILESALTSVAGNVQALWAAGARHFLILNVPDLALTPAVRAAGPAAAYYGSWLTGSFDAGLAQLVGALRALPGASFDELDVDARLQQLVDRPQDYGFTNVVDPCLAFGTVVHPVCAQPSAYLFWDGMHPTVAGHRAIAAAALEPVRTLYRRLHWSWH